MLWFYLLQLETEEEKSKMEAIYLCHRSTMKVTATHILKSEDRADDAVHDAFIKLTDHMDAIEEVDSKRTKSFLCLVTRHIAYDMLRADKRHPAVSMCSLGEMQQRTADMMERLAEQELNSMIKELPVTYQDVLELKAYQELSDKEIAVVLGISDTAARKRLQRARMLLLNVMEERGEMDVRTCV